MPQKIALQFEGCVACPESIDLSWEHPIPEAIGGQVLVKMLCHSCNNKFGHQLDAELKHDPQLRQAMEHLRNMLPRLHQDYNEGLEFVAKGSLGATVHLKMKDGKLRLREGQLTDGSIAMDSSRTLRFIEDQLKRSGRNQDIEAMKAKYLSAPYDEMIQITTTTAVARRRIEDIEVKLSSNLVSDQFKLRLCYVHLAMLVSPSIREFIGDYPEYFQPILAAIHGIATIPEHVEVSSGMRRTFQPEPYHLVRYVAEPEGLSVKVRLFNVLEYAAKFTRLNPGQMDLPLWIHDLKNRQIFIARTYEEFKKGEYCEFGPANS